MRPSRSSSSHSSPGTGPPPRTVPRIVPSEPWIQKGLWGLDVSAQPTSADQRARPVLVVDRRPGAPRRLALGRLVRRSVLDRPHRADGLLAQPAARDVEPVDGVVVEDKVLDLVEDGADREAVVVVVEMADGDDVADGALLDEQGGRTPGGSPAPVLVDRDREARVARPLRRAREPSADRSRTASATARACPPPAPAGRAQDVPRGASRCPRSRSPGVRGARRASRRPSRPRTARTPPPSPPAARRRCRPPAGRSARSRGGGPSGRCPRSRRCRSRGDSRPGTTGDSRARAAPSAPPSASSARIWSRARARRPAGAAAAAR